MRTYEQWQTYKKLELISSAESGAQWQGSMAVALFCMVKQWFQSNVILHHRPQIEQIVDGAGRSWWRIDDPKRDRPIQVKTHQDVLNWIENQHRQQPRYSSWDMYL